MQLKGKYGEMELAEQKKASLPATLEILKKYSDKDHLLTQQNISDFLLDDYGIELQRAAIGRNLKLLTDMGYDIISVHEGTVQGSYLGMREFDESEVKLLIDAVLSSKYISSKQSTNLIERLCGLLSSYFKANVGYVYSVDQWNKTENKQLFYNIDILSDAIEHNKRIRYDYNKYGPDKVLKKTKTQHVTPYYMFLHKQKYYLMGYAEYFHRIVYHRIDRITNIQYSDNPATPLRSLPDYKNGIDFKMIASSMPYMYSDKPEMITLLVDESAIDDVIEEFGKDITILKTADPRKYEIYLKSSPTAMEYWGLQYIQRVEIKSPDWLREKIKNDLVAGMEKYK